MMLVTLSPPNSAISPICNVCIFSHDSAAIEGESYRVRERKKNSRKRERLEGGQEPSPFTEVQRKVEKEKKSEREIFRSEVGRVMSVFASRTPSKQPINRRASEESH